MPSDQRFGKHERLSRRRDVARVFAERCSVGNSALVVYVAKNGLAWSRLGISVGRRLGNAVVRNYARRRIRESFRINKHGLPKGYDVMCIAREKATHSDYDLGRSLCTLVTRGVRRWEANEAENKPPQVRKTGR